MDLAVDSFTLVAMCFVVMSCKWTVRQIAVRFVFVYILSCRQCFDTVG